MISTSPHHQQETDQSHQQHELCILWSPLPIITWFLPFVGHLGMSDSSGTMNDFQGPYTVGQDNHRMAFGRPTRFYPIQQLLKDSDVFDEPDFATRWDEAIDEANRIYRGRMHNICWDNCHSHVGYALQIVSKRKWNMVQLATFMFFQGRFVNGWSSICQQFGPFCVFLLLVYFLA